MSKISRNAPCPCGSGKKYKKCCLDKDEQIGRNDYSPPPMTLDDIHALDKLSNSVIDLINDGKLDEAEATCKELKRRFPDEIDWMERSAMVYEAQGKHLKAAEYFAKAAEYARSHTGFDPELIAWHEERAVNNQRKKQDDWTINFECKTCKKEFDCNVGKVTINEETIRPDFEKPIMCPQCGERSIDDVFLTELGQSQMTEATWDL